MDQIQRIQVEGGLNPKTESVLHMAQNVFCEAGFDLVQDNPDLIVVIGGDGSYLDRMRVLDYPDVPAVGINAGTVGYFQEVDANRINQFVEDLENQHYKIFDRKLIAVGNVGQAAVGLAINEIFVRQPAIGRAMHAHISINDTEFSKFAGDGIMVSTPQGSTAYAVNAGGAIIADTLPALQIVASNPMGYLYQSFKQPIVFPDDVEVKIKSADPEHRPLVVAADGNEVDVDHKQELFIRKSDRKIKVLRTNRFDYFERLAEKVVNLKQI